MHTTIDSHGTPIRLTQIEPTTDTLHPAILYLHGAGGDTTYWPDRLAPCAQRIGASLYAPHYLDRTHDRHATADIIFDGVHVPQWLETVTDALDYVRSRPNVDPNRIALVGVSLGAFLSLAHASLHPGIRCIAEISGGIVEPFASHATSAYPPTLILHGEIDQVVAIDQARALEQRLQTLGIAHERHILPGETHYFTAPAAHRIVEYIADFFERYL
jgi:dienelactone hydrolase